MIFTSSRRSFEHRLHCVEVAGSDLAAGPALRPWAATRRGEADARRFCFCAIARAGVFDEATLSIAESMAGHTKTAGQIENRPPFLPQLARARPSHGPRLDVAHVADAARVQTLRSN